MRVYVAGPMRGKPLHNWPAFEDATATLRAAGFDVVTPTEIDEEIGCVIVERLEDGSVWDVCLAPTFDFDEVIARDLEAVRSCGGIVLLDGWHLSEGAMIELSEAVDHGLVVMYGVEAALARSRPSGEVRVVDPISGGAKGEKLARFDLLPPDALWALAEHYGRGARKYEDRNWEKGYRYGLSYGALQRHLNQWWGGEEIDEETGGHHLAAVAFHALALLTFRLRQLGTDDRSLPNG